ncbi:hypothetical protein CON44_18700 [Bacillus cereus]|nr:hypothetical protein CON44_18700 [Bacillus cereus]
MPAFIKSTKDNKKLYGKTTFCLKIYLKLMDVGSRPMPINLTEQVAPKTIKMNFIAIKDSNFSFWGHYKILT